MGHSVNTFTFLKRPNIFSRKREPLTVLAFLRKPDVPIALYARRVISLDAVDWLKLLGKFDGDFTFPPYWIIRSPNLVLST